MLALAGALASSGCADGCTEAREPRKPASQTDEGSSGRPLVIGMADEPTTLDPALVDTTCARLMLGLVHRGLVRFDERGRVEPDLAREMPNLSVTATVVQVLWSLRPRSWEDGTPVTAADVRFAWSLERRPDSEAVNALMAREVMAIRPRGPRAFVAEWPAPRPSLVAPGTHTVLPSHAYPEPEPGIPFEGQGRRPLSNGPYRLKSWELGVQARFEPNPHWPEPQPNLRDIRIRFYSSEDALLLALLRGEVDAAGDGCGLSASKASVLKEKLHSTHAVHQTDGGLWVHLIPSLHDPVTGDLAFRRALDRRLDRAELAKLYGADAALPTLGLFPANHPAHRQLEAPAPMADVDLERVRELARRHPTVDVNIAAESKRGADLATLIGEALEPWGFRVAIRAIPFGVLNARLEAGTLRGLTLYGWRIRPDWDAYSILHSEGRQNFNRFSDSKIDGWLDQLQRTVDPAGFGALLAEVQARHRQLLPSIPLFHGQLISVRPRWLGGWRPTGTTTPVTWNAESWTVDLGAVSRGRTADAAVASEPR